MTWNTYFTGTEEDIIAANNQININCNFPDLETTTWDIPKKAFNQDFWFISMPSPEGYTNNYGSWTQDQMINSVINVEEEESQTNWWPPANDVLGEL